MKNASKRNGGIAAPQAKSSMKRGDGKGKRYRKMKKEGRSTTTYQGSSTTTGKKQSWRGETVGEPRYLGGSMKIINT